MAKRLFHTLLGLVAGILLPLGIGSVIASIQGVHADQFIYSVTHRISFYSTFFQLGVAANIGVFFLIMRYDKLIHIGRGWLIATLLGVLWAVAIELNAI